MEGKVTLSEKITDQSSNQSSFSEMIFKKQQPKSIGENTTQDENVQNNDVKVVRKYTMERVIFRKEFVPVLKPIEMHLVPSKLKLNNIHFRHQKRNGNALNCISCPCSEDENEIDKELDLSNSSSDMSDISDLSNNINNNNNINNVNENGLKEIRKKFIKIKSGSIHKVMTKNNLKNRKLSRQFDCFDNSDVEEEEFETDKIKDEEDSNSFDLYEDDINFINYSIKPDDFKGFKYKQAKSSKIFKNYDDIADDDINDKNISNKDCDIYNKKRSRIFSFTILDTLKNRRKLEK
jgi:hypothetical protein